MTPRYNPSDFAESLLDIDQAENNGQNHGHAFQDDGAELPAVDVETLEVATWLKYLIATGRDPTYQGKHPSRSEAHGHATEALLKAGIDEPIILSLLLDARYKISERPREKGRKWLAGDIARIKAKLNGQRPTSATPPDVESTADSDKIDDTSTSNDTAQEKTDADAGDEQPPPPAEAPEAANASRAPDHVHLTDWGNAQRLIHRYGRNLHYVDPWGKWLHWNGRNWARDHVRATEVLGKRVIGELFQWASHRIEEMGTKVSEADENTRAELSKQLAPLTAVLNWALKSESASRIKAMVELAKSEGSVPTVPEELDSDPWLLNCLNGTIDLHTGQLRPHRRADLITKICPVHYAPHARAELWDNFLQKILPDEQLRAFVQRALGYSCSGDTSEEKLFFPHGPTATGKSTLLAAIGATLGPDYATTADFETFLARERYGGGPRNDIARLAGKRFVVSLEVDDGKHLAEALVKQLTGGDLVSARFLYQESFEFLPTFKLWLAANHRPVVRDDDDAVWRRILQIPFTVQIPEGERDPTVKARLRTPQEAGAAILAWIVQGVLAWQRDGLNVPAAVNEATADYRQRMDPLSGFLEDRCVTSPAAKVRKSVLWETYQAWAKENDVWMLSRNQIAERLRQRGFDELNDGKVRWWIGLGLITDTFTVSYAKVQKG